MEWLRAALAALTFMPSTGEALAWPGLEHRNSTLPVNFGYMLFPGFANIDVFAPADSLALLAFRHRINLYFLSDTLDPVSTKPQAASMNPFNSSIGTNVLPTHTFAAPPPIDVLLVPGGLGTRAPELDPHIAFIRDAFPGLQYLVTICTGAGLAARAGVLDGRQATTNKLSWNSTTAWGNDTDWKAPARWWADGKVWSTSGEAAGLDGVLAWIGHVFGDEDALWVADGQEHRALDWWQDEFSATDKVTRTYPCGEAPRGFKAPPQCSYP